MRIPTAIILAASAGTACAQASPRAVQFRSIDFENGIIELFNFDEIDADLSRWRFCSHDFDQERRYTGANSLNGITIEAGTSLFIHFNNDAPAADPDRIDRSSLGNFATPLDQDAYGIQIYFPASNGNVSFGNGALIADHLQWNIAGQGAGQAERRTSIAVGQQLWTAIGDFIPTQADSAGIELTDLSGDEIGGPTEYQVNGPAGGPCNEADISEPFGTLDLSDVQTFLIAFGGSTPAADIAEPFGTLDLSDVQTFLIAFGVGCP